MPVLSSTIVSIHSGLGVSGVVDGHAVVAGRPSWLESALAMVVPASLAARAEAAEAAGQTAVYAGWDGQVRGAFIVADTVKPASAEAIARVRCCLQCLGHQLLAVHRTVSYRLLN